MRYRRHKYNAKKTVIDEITFDSKAEAKRYAELKLLERAGEIKHLKLQPRYLLQESYKKNGKTIRKIEYVADFEYVDMRSKIVVIEDVKGVRTPVYKLKKKIFEYKYPNFEITEVGR
ncbi:MAG: DUF1064 domain-containing protein [Saccharofermentanales bacterium]|jgi:hypothetical protein